jgi:hypothetical protein
MKPLAIKFGLLFAATLLFYWSYTHFKEVRQRSADRVVMMQYEVLDKQVWSMDEAQKQQALSQDDSYMQIEQEKSRASSAALKSKAGLVLAILLGAASLYFFVRLLYAAFYVKLVREKGYEGLVDVIERSSGLPLDDEDDGATKPRK